MYIYVYMYIYIHVCMYVYTYMWMDGWMDGWIHPFSRMAAMGRPRVQPSDVPAAHATTRLSGQIFHMLLLPRQSPAQ